MNRNLLIAICLFALNAMGETPCDKTLSAGVAEFKAAYQAWDGTRFSAASELFRQTTTNACASATHFYWLGASEFHVMLQLQHSPGSATNKAAAEKALGAALEALSQAVKLDEKHAESHALIGTLYGMKINGSALRGAWFGPRLVRHRDLAVALGAENPRVHYLIGMCQYHTASTPTAWKEALTTLLAAEKLFETESKHANHTIAPRWGRSSCLTFIGQTYERLGQKVKAAEYFRRALEEHAADHLAKAGLQRVTGNK